MAEDALIRDLSAAVERNPDAVEPEKAGEQESFNWSAAEEEVADIIEPAFVDYGGGGHRYCGNANFGR